MMSRERLGSAIVAGTLLAAAASIVAIAVTRDAAPTSSGRASVTAVVTSPARDSAAGTAPRVPERIAIPVLGVYAPVSPVGQDSTGGVAVPDDIARIGWYLGSEMLGSDHGTTVLVGHRDGRDVGAGAFFALDTLRQGDRILVAGAGAAETFLVQSVEIVDKHDFASVTSRVFTSDGAPRLILVSCGGEFDFDIGSYESNVIVTASPE